MMFLGTRPWCSDANEGFRKLLDQTEALRVRHGLKKVVYGMEPTANYHKPPAEFLIHLERCVVLVSGVTAKRNRESLDGRWDKYDVKDSANVADMISQGKCLYYDFPTVSLRGFGICFRSRGGSRNKSRVTKEGYGII